VPLEGIPSLLPDLLYWLPFVLTEKKTRERERERENERRRTYKKERTFLANWFQNKRQQCSRPNCIATLLTQTTNCT
jgi:hypothetical protein